jgi:hypothetical protein
VNGTMINIRSSSHLNRHEVAMPFFELSCRWLMTHVVFDSTVAKATVEYGSR